MQRDHPIAFFSKPFCPRLLRASTYVRELHAITTAVRKWRQYLLGHPFIILTDHKSLKELMSQVVQTPEQQIYLSKLLGYDYTIQYKVGKSNIVADALSRIQEDTEGKFFILSMPHFTFLEQLRNSLKDSNEFQSLFDQVLHQPNSHPNFTIHNGLLLFKGKIWLDSTNPFRALLMEEFHKTPLGGHMGFAKTLQKIQANFFWATLRHDVKLVVAQCITCQQTKYETKRPAGLLQPIPIPSAV